jgi:outer membrane protein TolC
MLNQIKFCGQLMKRHKYLVLFILAITFGAAPQYGNAQEGPVLKLDQAIKMALQTDTDLIVADHNLTKAKLAVDLAKINNLPSASGDVDANDYFEDNDTSRNLQLKVEQTIPTKWHLYGTDTATDVETKRWAVNKSEAALRIARAETVYEVTNLYFSALKALKNLEYQQLVVGYAREKAKYNKLQLQYGKITKTTQLTAENEFTKAKHELEKTRQSYQLALKKLASQIGVAASQKLTLDQSLLTVIPDKIDYEKEKRRAITNRPEVIQYQMELKSAEQEWAVAKNNGLPTLDLSFQNRDKLQSFDTKYDFLSGDFSWSTAWQKSYSGTDDETMENFNFEDMFGSKRRKISLTLTLDLDFGSASNKTKQAYYTMESAQRNLEQAYQDIALEIDEAASDYEGALVTLNNNKDGIPLYQKTVELLQMQLKMRMTTALELKKAQLDLADCQTDVATATCDLLIANQKLQLKLGQLYDRE